MTVLKKFRSDESILQGVGTVKTPIVVRKTGLVRRDKEDGVALQDFPWKREEAWMLAEAFFRQKLGDDVEDPWTVERIQRIRTAFDLIWIDKAFRITLKATDLESA